MEELNKELSNILSKEYLIEYLQINEETAFILIDEINKFVKDSLHQSKRNSFIQNKPDVKRIINRHPIYKPNLDTFCGRLENIIAKILLYCP